MEVDPNCHYNINHNNDDGNLDYYDDS